MSTQTPAGADRAANHQTHLSVPAHCLIHAWDRHLDVAVYHNGGNVWCCQAFGVGAPIDRNQVAAFEAFVVEVGMRNITRAAATRFLALLPFATSANELNAEQGETA
jgi:hypothetical protein